MNLPKNLDLFSEKQKEVTNAFVSGNDLFCCFAIGYGKSLCYSILPKVYDLICNYKGLPIVLCVSPLVVLMMDQKKSLLILAYLMNLYLKTHCYIERVLQLNLQKTSSIFDESSPITFQVSRCLAHLQVFSIDRNFRCSCCLYILITPSLGLQLRSDQQE